MHTKKLMTLLLAVVLVLSLAACGAKGGDHMDGMDNEPKTAEEAAAMHKELTAQEAAILAENTALWEKVFMAADKGKIMMEDGKNYGDFLLETINAAKDQFSADELKLLQSEAEKIRDIGNKLAALEEKYPEIMQKSLDSDMNMPADKDMDTMPDGGSKDNKTDGGNTGNKTDSGSTGNTPDNGSTGNKTDSGSTGSKTDDSSLPKFPAFEGKDLDGNTVKSSDLFSGKAVTVVNFWFTTCGPCVGELGDLDALNKELSGKGGALIGINAFTLDGNEAAISDAKDVLTQSGATYQNVYFDSGSEAGKFVESIYAYPTTYVVNRSGRIVGDPIVGAITSKAQADALQAQIDKALAADMG
jgi:thiol-disulfide isomerase/thioredoxin/predicted small lipoprotein YifL